MESLWRLLTLVRPLGCTAPTVWPRTVAAFLSLLRAIPPPFPVINLRVRVTIPRTCLQLNGVYGVHLGIPRERVPYPLRLVPCLVVRPRREPNLAKLTPIPPSPPSPVLARPTWQQRASPVPWQQLGRNLPLLSPRARRPVFVFAAMLPDLFMATPSNPELTPSAVRP